MSPLNAADVVERVRGVAAAAANNCLLGSMIAMILPTMITCVGILANDGTGDFLPALAVFDIFGAFIALPLLIAFFVYRNRERHAENHMIFKRYGGPQTVANIINAANHQQVYRDKYFLFTPTYIMKPNDYTTFMPTSCMLLACKEDRRGQAMTMLLTGPLIAAAIYGNKPAGLFLAAYNCYGDRVDYAFGGRTDGSQIDLLVNMIQPYAPQCAIGDSPLTRAYLAQNTRIPPM